MECHWLHLRALKFLVLEQSLVLKFSLIWMVHAINSHDIFFTFVEVSAMGYGLESLHSRTYLSLCQ